MHQPIFSYKFSNSKIMALSKQNKIVAIHYVSFFMLGMTFNSLGPLIPFLSEKAGSSQSDFVYLTIIRGFVYLFTGLIDRFLFSKIKTSIKLFICLTIMGICLGSFVLTINKILLGILFGFVAFSSCLLQILISSAILQIGGADSKVWISWLYAFYGIGAIIGPLIIGFLGLEGIVWQGVITSAGAWLYFMKQFQSDNFKAGESEECIPKIIIIKRNLSKRIQMNLVICIIMCMSLLYIFRTFIATYAVQTNSASPKGASFLVSVHFVALTFTRLIIPLVNITSQRILRVSLVVILISCCVFTIMSFTPYGYLTCLLSCIMLGLTFSPLFPLIFSLPATKGFNVSPTTISNVLAGQAIGQGIMVSAVGYLLSITYPCILFISIVIFGIIVFKYLNFMIDEMDQIISKETLPINNPQSNLTQQNQKNKNLVIQNMNELEQNFLIIQDKKGITQSLYDIFSRTSQQLRSQDQNASIDMERWTTCSKSVV